MIYPIITVRNIHTGTIHIVGENIHDVLYIDNAGAIQYLNSQCMAGTGDGYEFVGEPVPEWSFFNRPEVKFVTLDELIDMALEHVEEGTKKKIESYKALRKMLDEEMQKTREETGIKFDTGGDLP